MKILVLAVSELDGQSMQRDALEVHPKADIVIATDPRSIDGLQPDEFVMTEAFASQRSVRMIMATQRELAKAGGQA